MILEVLDGSLRWVRMLDDDGGTKENKDGTEAGRNTFVLTGAGDGIEGK